MAAKDYSLLLKASIDPSNLQSQIDAISEKYSINLKINADDSALAELKNKIDQTMGSASSTPVKIINLPSELEALNFIQARIKEIESTGLGTGTKFNIPTTIDDSGQKVATSATLTYADAQGKLNKEVYEYVAAADAASGAAGGWTEVSGSLSKNIAAQDKTMQGLINSANQFLEKSKLLDQSNPNVQKAVAIAQQMTDGTARTSAEMVKLGASLKTAQAGIDGTKASALSFTESMKNAIVMTTEMALSVGLLFGAINQLKQGIQYVIDLNKEMTKIQVLQVEGAKTTTQINDLAQSFNTLAGQLGATTIEVAKGSVEWLRQGKTIAETQELIKSTMMLSKLGALDSAAATEDLTAILNGFNMKTSEAESVVSKLVAIDNIAATSAGG